MEPAYGMIVKDDDGWTIYFLRQLDQPQSVVWDAIVGPGQMSRWFDRTEFPEPLAVDGTITFFHDAFRLKSQGVITALEPPFVIEWMWTSTIAPDQLISWSVIPDGGGCRLTLGQKIPDESLIARTMAGWHTCLERLEAMLNDAPDEPLKTDWPQLFEYYRQVCWDHWIVAHQQGAPPAVT